MTERLVAARKKSLKQPVEPISVGDLLRSTLIVVRCHYLRFFLLALPFGLVSVLLEQSIVTVHPTTQQDSRIFAILSFYGTCVLGYLADAIISVFAIQYVDNRRGAKRGIASLKWQRLGSILVIAILAPLGTIAGLAVAVVPGVILWLSWSVAAPAAAIAGEGPFEAIRHSARLTWGSRRALLYTFTVMYVCTEGALFSIGVAMGQSVTSLLQDSRPLSPAEILVYIVVDTIQIALGGALCCVAYAKLLVARGEIARAANNP